MKRFNSARQLQRFVSIHDPVANLFHLPRDEVTSASFREMRSLAMQTCVNSPRFKSRNVEIAGYFQPERVRFTVPANVIRVTMLAFIAIFQI